MMDDKFKQMISEAFEIDINSVSGDMKLDPEGNWDSIAHLSVLSGIDNEYGIIVKGEDLVKCKKIDDSVAYTTFCS